MPDISVIVPVYNTEKYLDECIVSILKQTYKNIELILVDDGSTDRSSEICEKYKELDSRVMVIHTSNRGKIMARREGVLRSNSQYVTFVDSDDFIDEHAYEYAAYDMRAGADIICFGIRRYWENSESINQPLKFLPGIYLVNDIKREIYPYLLWPSGDNMDPSLCTKLIKRKFLLEQYEKIKALNIDYAEDAVTIYPIIKRINKLVIKQEIYYNHRQNVAAENKYYIRDNSYYDKVYRMYDYLKREFLNVPIILEQIDKYYIRAVNYRKIELNNWKIKVVDADEINSYETLILYGAGVVARKAIPYLSKIGVDKFIISVTEANEDEYLFGNRVFSIREVHCNKLKALVLLAVSKRTQSGIKEYLRQLGYKKIISMI